jgi:hypothetical protein
MMLNEDRLRELYAAGEIDLAEFERSMAIVLSRKAAEPAAPSDAGRPISPRARERMVEASGEHAASGAASQGPAPKCPRCGYDVRPVVEYGVQTAWCQTCNAYAGPDPRDVLPQPKREQSGSVWVAGGIFPLGPHGIDLG